MNLFLSLTYFVTCFCWVYC